MECCDVKLIGTLTGVLAHFRCNRKGLTRRGEDAKKTRGGDGMVGVGCAVTTLTPRPPLPPAGDGEKRVCWGEGWVGG